MAQQIINVGTAPNDGLGDPLRTAFTKTNDNFSQLFATAGITGIANGTSNVRIPLVNGNVNISSAGTPNVLIVTGTGVYSTGTLNSTGLATLSNLSVTGAVVSTGTIQSLADVTAVNITASGNLSANNAVITSNISAGYFSGNGAGLTGVIATGNVGAASQLTNGTTTMNIPVADGNITGAVSGVTGIFNLSTIGLGITGISSASGNIIGGNLLSGGLASVHGNIFGGNLTTDGLISAIGNITGNYILGNGSSLTGINVPNISNGTSNVTVVSSGGNISVGIGGTANVAVWATTGEYITGVMSANGNITGGNILTGGLISATSTITSGANISAGNILTSGLISATSTITSSSDITGGNLLTGGVVSATGNVRGSNINTVGLVTATGNVFAGNVVTGGLITATGNIIAGNVSVAKGTLAVGNIVNSNGNAVGNIGSSSNYFNQVFAQATTALYADLAEIYSADAEYSPGTVVSFGGDREVTKSVVEGDPRVAGVISENPSYLMNSGLEVEHRAAVALTGRVPTLVMGPVAKGDMMVSAGNGWARASATPAMGTVIGKALINFDGDSGIIEIVVGRM